MGIVYCQDKWGWQIVTEKGQADCQRKRAGRLSNKKGCKTVKQKRAWSTITLQCYSMTLIGKGKSPYNNRLYVHLTMLSNWRKNIFKVSKFMHVKYKLDELSSSICNDCISHCSCRSRIATNPWKSAHIFRWISHSSKGRPVAMHLWLGSTLICVSYY